MRRTKFKNGFFSYKKFEKSSWISPFKKKFSKKLNLSCRDMWKIITIYSLLLLSFTQKQNIHNWDKIISNHATWMQGNLSSNGNRKNQCDKKISKKCLKTIYFPFCLPLFILCMILILFIRDLNLKTIRWEGRRFCGYLPSLLAKVLIQSK